MGRTNFLADELRRNLGVGIASLSQILTTAAGVPVLSCIGLLSVSSHKLSVLEQSAEEKACEFAKKRFPVYHAYSKHQAAQSHE